MCVCWKIWLGVPIHKLYKRIRHCICTVSAPLYNAIYNMKSLKKNNNTKVRMNGKSFSYLFIWVSVCVCRMDISLLSCQSYWNHMYKERQVTTANQKRIENKCVRENKLFLDEIRKKSFRISSLIEISGFSMYLFFFFC